MKLCAAPWAIKVPARSLEQKHHYPTLPMSATARHIQKNTRSPPACSHFLKIRSGHCRKPLVSSAENVLLIRLGKVRSAETGTSVRIARNHHRVEHVEEYVGDGPAYAWVMSNAREYTQAKEYVRPQGAIKWVHVPPATVSCRILFSSKSVPNIFSKFPR